ncbi:MAG TPA: lysylphosphatidylglycerol synthase transmembrane domain-containing protein [Pyrinomonadaceae bacterium]|nr:lysylphosphatidylglycerol synthase transmembrane domain-containing protein [Pyrinomonadaceae bacterium]
MRKRLHFIVLFLIAVLIIWWFGRGLNWAEVKQTVWQSDWRLLTAAIGVSCLVYALSASRCRALLEPFASARWLDVFIATIIGIVAMFIAGRAGDGVRALMITSRDRRVPPSASLVTVVLERLCDIGIVITLFGLNLLWLSPPAGREDTFAHLRVVGAVLLLGILSGVACLWLFQRKADAILPWLGRRGKYWTGPVVYARRLIIRVFEQLAKSLRVFVDLRELAIVVGWTVLLWCVNAVTIWLVLKAFGLTFGFSHSVFVMGWTLVGSLLPTPGGAAGAYHAATAAALVVLGADRDQAAAVAIVLHLVGYTPALLFAFYFIMKGDVSLGRLQHLRGVRPVGGMSLE